MAAHSVQLMGELQRARERLVLAREEERRRLRRDLHDDLAPSLAALGLTAATVGELIPRNPEAAAQVAAKLHTAIRTVVGDVRRLVYDLRPPTLDEAGPGRGDPRARDSRMRPVACYWGRACQAPGSARCSRAAAAADAAVEVAAFRLAQEALTNVLRHAEASRCTIRLAAIEGRAFPGDRRRRHWAASAAPGGRWPAQHARARRRARRRLLDRARCAGRDARLGVVADQGN